MAFHKFVSAIQAARGVLFGRMNQAIHTPPTDVSRWWDVVRDTADIWLTPKIVEDYDDTEFQFLPPEQQAKLGRLVDAFRQLTATAKEAPTEAQLKEGFNLLTEINHVIAPSAGEDPDLRRIIDVIRSVPWPDYVFGADFRLGNDSTGDPAVWIWLLLNDDVEIESRAVQDELGRVRRAYLDEIQKAGINRWPYVSVRTRSETKNLIAGAA